MDDLLLPRDHGLMDVTQALKDAENALRDFISSVLIKEFGANWVSNCGVSDERLARWNERKEAEGRRQAGGVVEERAIYYADFFDLKVILKKHWPKFSPALGEWRTIEVFLSELEKLRDPDAHRRELLPHQKHLAVGISGEIRSRLVRYRSKQETEEDYFPRIESVRDSLGNIWVPSEMSTNTVFTNGRLRPRDLIDFVITATDPLGDPLSYGIWIGREGIPHWSESNQVQAKIEEHHVGKSFTIGLFIKSPRQYHASSFWDDTVNFVYVVLPPMS